MESIETGVGVAAENATWRRAASDGVMVERVLAEWPDTAVYRGGWGDEPLEVYDGGSWVVFPGRALYYGMGVALAMHGLGKNPKNVAYVSLDGSFATVYKVVRDAVGAPAYCLVAGGLDVEGD